MLGLRRISSVGLVSFEISTCCGGGKRHLNADDRRGVERCDDVCGFGFMPFQLS